MSDRKKVNRGEQRRARELQDQLGIAYVQALGLVRQGLDRGGVAIQTAPPNGSAATPTGWLKSLHHRPTSWTIAPGEESWISDIGRFESDGSRRYRADGAPWGEPSWKVGDLVGLYLSGTLKVPVLVEVMAPPRFDPAFVERYNYGGEPDAGGRWPWVTEVRGVLDRPLPQAPTLDDIGVPRESMRQRPRKLLTPTQLHSLEQLLR